ncbi:carbon monoxide dehydrogenase subunit G [Gluconacetobacter azotocaptans]|uniref:Carbon monoxide dehydrogenase subunit G n=1 Tax=Gluconacetobacter azotocaptans TaxID=142834 RepID=A0A7W4JQL7_9PROT|nr:carbon monoxide dehydrogenase subunit G [Gluconacetobacter azotocaptans]MBB2188962.1 carbon monoxide dehydrogenase subunit G [Gluconacetobacter azotocaptans]MBM9401466.1 carbon monoxide dehydrogenase subunit G [Gluconacetobacter azotocaptans]GBQ25896.1 carbon monoxide dehydrogenase subunit G [Gluconacetobacter azotocaptans DSM 13594]
MNLQGQFDVPASMDAVWAGLNDPSVLLKSIPGCTLFESTGPDEYAVAVEARVGPIFARFGGKIEIRDIVPGRGYVISGRGQGGAAGFARGETRVELTPKGEQTTLTYESNFEIGGKMAVVGGRIINGVASEKIDAFFAAFSRQVAGGDAAEEESVTAAAPRGVALPGNAMAATGISLVALVMSVLALVVSFRRRN